MLLSAPYSADRFRAPVVSGLRSLLVAPDTGRGTVLTRAAAAAALRGYITARDGGGGGGEDAGASGDGSSIERSEDTNNSKEDEEAKDEKEAGGTEEDEELEGFWVSYGRRCPRRRLLPSPIPSLVARGALRRTRTGDGRLVIRVVPVVRPECIRARRRGDRLTMQLVEHEEDSPMMLPPLRELSTSTREDGDIVGAIAQAAGEDDTATPEPATEAVASAPEPETTMAQALPPPRVSSAGCSEDVFKFDPIGSSSLHQMPSLRMVH